MVTYTNSTLTGDSICMDVPLMKAGGELNYEYLTMTNMQILYGEISPTDSEGICNKRCARTTKDRDVMSMGCYKILMNI